MMDPTTLFAIRIFAYVMKEVNGELRLLVLHRTDQKRQRNSLRNWGLLPDWPGVFVDVPNMYIPQTHTGYLKSSLWELLQNQAYLSVLNASEHAVGTFDFLWHPQPTLGCPFLVHAKPEAEPHFSYKKVQYQWINPAEVHPEGLVRFVRWERHFTAQRDAMLKACLERWPLPSPKEFC